MSWWVFVVELLDEIRWRLVWRRAIRRQLEIRVAAVRARAREKP